MDVKTRWNLTLQLLERAYQLREFTWEWLMNPLISEYQPHSTTLDESITVNCIMEVFRPIWYWTLLMSKRLLVTLYHVVTFDSQCSQQIWLTQNWCSLEPDQMPWWSSGAAKTSQISYPAPGCYPDWTSTHRILARLTPECGFISQFVQHWWQISFWIVIE